MAEAGTNAGVLDQLIDEEPRLIAVSTRRLNKDMQPRAAIDNQYISDLTERMDVDDQGWVVDPEGERFPPTVEFYDGDTYWTADGHHRTRAAREAGIDKFQSIVKRGDKRDAMLYSKGTNARHGKRRTRKTKRRNVMSLLLDDEWKQWSDREIARKCKVSPTLVGTVRKELEKTEDDYNAPKKRKYKSQGEVKEMDTTSQSNQSKSSKSPADEKPNYNEDDSDLEPAFDRINPEFCEVGYDEFRMGAKLFCADVREYVESAGADQFGLAITRGPSDRDQLNWWDLAKVMSESITEHGMAVTYLRPDDQYEAQQELRNRFDYSMISVVATNAEWRLQAVWSHSPISGDLPQVLYRGDNTIDWGRVYDTVIGVIAPDKVLSPSAADGTCSLVCARREIESVSVSMDEGRIDEILSKFQ